MTKKMRWIGAVLLTVLLVFAAAGCGSAGPSSEGTVSEPAVTQAVTETPAAEAAVEEGSEETLSSEPSEEPESVAAFSVDTAGAADTMDTDSLSEEIAAEAEKIEALESQLTALESKISKIEKENSAAQSASEAESGEFAEEVYPEEEIIEITTTTEGDVFEDLFYTGKEDVALYIVLYGHLPYNYITKEEAESLGWAGGSLEPYAPGMSIGGSRFGNYEGLLPKAKGRKYYECDIDYDGGKRNAKRLVYSNDGLVFYTEDHYASFEQLY